jgi:MATE family multidrug resistance protein
MDGFAYAGEALGGKFYGAGNVVALRRVTRLLFVWGGAMVALYTFVYAVLGADFLSLLTDDTTVRRAATGYYFWTLVIPVAGVAAFIYDGLFIGMTATRGMLLSCFLSAVLFFAVFYLLFPVLGDHALWMVYCLFLFMRGVIQYLYLLRSSFF